MGMSDMELLDTPPPSKKSKNNDRATESKTTESSNSKWIEFKAKKREERLQRQKQRGNYDIIAKAKRIGEELRTKSLKGGVVERNRLINDLHQLLVDKCLYSKFVKAHDTSRIVQWVLKYGSDFVRDHVSKELTPFTIEMINSKYGVHVVMKMFKYCNATIRHKLVDQFYGHVVKLCGHVSSATTFEYAYSTWASAQQKHHLQQEFYGDIYRSAKDNAIRQLRDTYRDSPDIKVAILSAVKANLLKIINKQLLDSQLVHTVLRQYIQECETDDRNELIAILTEHVVILSNSKNGTHVSQQIIWYGTNKDRKTVLKTVKPHIVQLSNHVHGHRTVITLLDSVDDTVVLNKIITNDLIQNCQELAKNEHGKKVLLWLITPENSTVHHPYFVNELNYGRSKSNCKKSSETRRKEIAQFAYTAVLENIQNAPEFWLGTGTISLITGCILKAPEEYGGHVLRTTLDSLATYVSSPQWQLQGTYGIEDAGVHMTLKKLVLGDSKRTADCSFSQLLIKHLSTETLNVWLKTNRGCFLLVAIYENATNIVQVIVKNLLSNYQDILSSQTTPGAKILLEKLLA